MTRCAPLPPDASLLSVGSPFTSHLLVAGKRLAARAPGELRSSPTTNKRSTRSSPASASCCAAISMAAAIPLASQAPRPYSLVPSSRGATNGGTVSRCVESVTPPPRRVAQTFERCGSTSCSVTFQPREMSQRATKSTASFSRPVVDSRDSSSEASATTSDICGK